MLEGSGLFQIAWRIAAADDDEIIECDSRAGALLLYSVLNEREQ